MRKKNTMKLRPGAYFFFFIKVQDTLKLYRIVKEQAIEPNKANSVLNNLKKSYGMQDKQQIKTGSVRPRNKRAYTTTEKIKLFGIFQKHRNL